jgi:hypothetical protein
MLKVNVVTTMSVSAYAVFFISAPTYTA